MPLSSAFHSLFSATMPVVPAQTALAPLQPCSHMPDDASWSLQTPLSLSLLCSQRHSSAAHCLLSINRPMRGYPWSMVLTLSSPPTGCTHTPGSGPFRRMGTTRSTTLTAALCKFLFDSWGLCTVSFLFFYVPFRHPRSPRPRSPHSVPGGKHSVLPPMVCDGCNHQHIC